MVIGVVRGVAKAVGWWRMGPQLGLWQRPTEDEKIFLYLKYFA